MTRSLKPLNNIKYGVCVYVQRNRCFPIVSLLMLSLKLIGLATYNCNLEKSETANMKQKYDIYIHSVKKRVFITYLKKFTNTKYFVLLFLLIHCIY